MTSKCVIRIPQANRKHQMEGKTVHLHPHNSKNITLYFIIFFILFIYLYTLSYDAASGSEITPCNKIDKPLVVYRFTGNVMTFITTLRT